MEACNMVLGYKRLNILKSSNVLALYVFEYSSAFLTLFTPAQI